ncbi:MAG: outer membrane lipoprotein carrier protein LolA [Nitrospirae bacterium]|nr:outer membrane lipoprotein carrier protein LolA [Nitrospirota bacterium]
MKTEDRAVMAGHSISAHSRKASKPFSEFKTITICLFSIFSLLPFAFCHADDQVEKIQKAYENIKDIRGNFIQKSHIKDLKRTDTYKGEFFIKSQKMRWEYKGDKPQAVYINGDDIIIYQKKERQAFKAKFDRATYGQSPIALLGGFGNIDNEFNVSTKNDKLILKPKKPMGNISHIELLPSDGEFPIESLTIIDTLSNRVEIHLKDVKINTDLKDKIFEFSPPEGVNILQQ